jgi:acetyl esterase
MKYIAFALVATALPLALIHAQKVKGAKSAPSMTDAAVKHEERLYKTTPQGKLHLHFSLPTDWKAEDKRPAIVFFFGGGWKNGSYLQFVAQSDYFASRGLVAASTKPLPTNAWKTPKAPCATSALTPQS